MGSPDFWETLLLLRVVNSRSKGLHNVGARFLGNKLSMRCGSFPLLTSTFSIKLLISA